jgi:hypothetical protein
VMIREKLGCSKIPGGLILCMSMVICFQRISIGATAPPCLTAPFGLVRRDEGSDCGTNS